MRNAKEMKQISDEHYLERYEEYIASIEEQIEAAAQRGFYHLEWSIAKDYCKDWTRSPFYDYFEGLKKEGYQVEVNDDDLDWNFEIAWR